MLVALKKQAESKVIRGGSFLEDGELIGSSYRVPGDAGRKVTTDVRDSSHALAKGLARSFVKGTVTDPLAILESATVKVAGKITDAALSSLSKSPREHAIGVEYNDGIQGWIGRPHRQDGGERLCSRVY